MAKRCEGYCTTILEAMRLCKPIVSTEFCGVREQITHGVTGIIVDIDAMKILEGVYELIQNKTMRKNFSSNLSNMMLNNEYEVDKLIKFIEA